MAKNYHDEMNDAFHKAEKKVAGKSSGGYDHDPMSLKPKNVRSEGKGGSGEYAERGDAVRVKKAEAKNKTGFGSKTNGADIDGGLED
jgi:hypothetical protein